MKLTLTSLLYAPILSVFISITAHAMEDLDDDRSYKIYGGAKGHEIYKKKSDEIIPLAIKQITELVAYSKKKNQDLDSYFIHFLVGKNKQGGLAKGRGQIAVEAESFEAPLFGVPRFGLNLNVTQSPLNITPFHGTCKPYWQTRAANFFVGNFSQLANTKRNFLSIQDNGGEKYDLKIINYADIHSNFEKTLNTDLDPQVKFACLNEVWECEALLTEEKLPKNSLSLTKSKILTKEIQILKVQKYFKGIPTTCLYSWVISDENSPNGVTIDNLNLLKSASAVMVRHIYSHETDKLLPYAAQYWKEAILWDKKNPEILSRKLASFSYIFSDIMPFERGSSGIMEWNLKSIAGTHGYEIKWDKAEEPNLDEVALITPYLNDSIAYFQGRVSLTPLKK